MVYYYYYYYYYYAAGNAPYVYVVTFTRPQTVTHPNTNRARRRPRRVTSLIETNALQLTVTVTVADSCLITNYDGYADYDYGYVCSCKGTEFCFQAAADVIDCQGLSTLATNCCRKRQQIVARICCRKRQQIVAENGNKSATNCCRKRQQIVAVFGNNLLPFLETICCRKWQQSYTVHTGNNLLPKSATNCCQWPVWTGLYAPHSMIV